MRKSPRGRHHADIRPWVKLAVAQEDAKPPDRMWKGEPSEAEILKEQRKRIRFLSKHGKTNPKARILAARLESCRPKRRCLSGACLECGRLLQRWFVRASRRFIANHLETRKGELVAICIVPASSMVAPGGLQSVSIENFHRRVKYALAKAKLDVAIGGVDFSFNEDREGKYQPFWSPHLYVITTARNKKLLKKKLAKQFQETGTTPRPIKISPFQNTAHRRSYALKTHFGRRVGYDQKKECECEDQVRECRNTSRDKLRANET